MHVTFNILDFSTFRLYLIMLWKKTWKWSSHVATCRTMCRNTQPLNTVKELYHNDRIFFFYLSLGLTQRQRKDQIHNEIIWIRCWRIFISTNTLCTCILSVAIFVSYKNATTYPEPSSFLLHMLDGNEGLWKELVLIIILYYISGDQSGSLKNRSFPEPFVFVEHAQ